MWNPYTYHMWKARQRHPSGQPEETPKVCQSCLRRTPPLETAFRKRVTVYNHDGVPEMIIYFWCPECDTIS